MDDLRLFLDPGSPSLWTLGLEEVGTSAEEIPGGEGARCGVTCDAAAGGFTGAEADGSVFRSYPPA